MPGKHYLLKVLGLSGIPKLFTFGITLISFPLLMRSLGSGEYGIVLFIGSTLAVFEVLIDLGVSSASGKAVAAVRTHRPHLVRAEFLVWARLQLVVAVAGFVPMILLVQLVIQASPSFQNVSVFWIMSVAMMFSMFLNFVRINLNSLLAFKSLAVLDTTQSVLTSSGFFIVAFWYPTAVGLALAGLTTSVIALFLATGLLVLQLSSVVKDQNDMDINIGTEWSGRHDSIKSRLQESANFLWLRLSTRLFQEGPIIFIGGLLGPEIIGIIGAFRKVSEIASTPYLVIGNALMVRVHEVSIKGVRALEAYWQTAIRIGSTSLVFCSLAFLLTLPVSQLLLPDNEKASELFSILSPLIVASAFFGILAPMSDYKGGLTMRNTLLSVTAVLQLVLLWIANTIAGEAGLIAIFVGVNLCLVIGYACITHKVFFNSFIPILRFEVFKFAIASAISCGIVYWLQDILLYGGIKSITSSQILMALLSSTIFFAVVALGLRLCGIWRFYFNRKFFEFSEL